MIDHRLRQTWLAIDNPSNFNIRPKQTLVLIRPGEPKDNDRLLLSNPRAIQDLFRISECNIGILFS